MKILSAKYITSATKRDSLILDETPEICFVGRSNVGKSSLINNLVGIKNLAKTSSTPGLTKMVNYFDINGGKLRFVDLPGYGFAKTSHGQKENWSSLMSDYLMLSASLKLVFVLVDIRHQPTALDRLMIAFLMEQGIPFAVIATKADKLSKMAISKSLKEISKTLSLREELIFVHSSKSGLGKEGVIEYIEQII